MLDVDLNEPGFLIQIDETNRVEEIRDRIHFNGYFTENVSHPDLDPPKVGLYAIGFRRGCLEALALGIHTGRTSTESDRIKLKRLCSFDETQIEHLVPATEIGRQILASAAAQDDIRIPADSMNELLAQIEGAYPEKKEEIETLIRLANGIVFENLDKSRAFQQQRDACFTAMSLANVNSDPLVEEWELDRFDDAANFLDPIPDEYAIEDYLIQFDQNFFDDWEAEEIPPHVHTRSFQNGNTRISITAVNREPVETLFGVDLIYYNEEKKSFTFIQYKAMGYNNGRYRYYPDGDENLAKELLSMRAMDALLQRMYAENAEALGDAIDQYRLISSPFLFKFCQRVNFDVASKSPTPGYYVPLDLWTAFEQSGRLGDRRGVVVEASTIEKHLSPRMVFDFIKANLVGTQPVTARFISALIKASLSSDRSVIFAVKEKINALYDDEDAAELLDA